MKTLEFTQKTGDDKLLHLTIPADRANQTYRVIVALAAEEEAKPATWPPGFIESTYGSIQDESFIRRP
jgi:hypothetical protein